VSHHDNGQWVNPLLSSSAFLILLSFFLIFSHFFLIFSHFSSFFLILLSFCFHPLLSDLRARGAVRVAVWRVACAPGQVGRRGPGVHARWGQAYAQVSRQAALLAAICAA
jgi:hypothetical protein